MVVIVDFGIGNLGSIKNILRRIGVDSIISSDSNDILSADKLILSGVGSFDHGMVQLHKSGLLPYLNEKVIQKETPILGICLGVQLFTQRSEEGQEPGLGWIEGETIGFDRSRLQPGHKIPHMGWTEVYGRKESRLFSGMYENSRFYFVHSFHLKLSNEQDQLLLADYGYEFTAGVEHQNILGVQFHPEKSHKYGIKLFENFIKHY